MVGRKQGWLHLFYIRFHGEDRKFSQRSDSTILRVFWENRTDSRIDEGYKRKGFVARITEERHDAIVVPADLGSQ